MTRYRYFLATLLFLALAGCANDEPPAQQHFPSDADIQALIQSRVDEGRAVGIVVGVMEADGSTRVFAAGEPGPGAQPFSEQSVFEIGSITKVFTGILLADMVAKGEVALDDPVMKYLPADEVTMPTRGCRDITLLDLSTHRSGLPRMPDNFDPADLANPYADYTVEQLYAFLTSHELRRDIDAQGEYSNLSVGLLGHVLALAAGSSYEDLVRERILEPLGMSSTGITLSDDMRHWLVQGHDMAGNAAANWDIVTLAGAGALRSNVQDMLAFIAANTGPAESPLEEAMRVTHEPRANLNGNVDIGLNWIILSIGRDQVVWHNGGTGGYHAFAGFDPERGVGAVVLTNSTDDTDDIGLHLINPEFPLTLPPRRRVEVPVSADILEAYVGFYPLAPEFALTVTVENGNLWVQATGQDNYQVFPESETEFFYTVVDAQLTFTKDDAGEVAGLVLHQGGRNTPAPKQELSR